MRGGDVWEPDGAADEQRLCGLHAGDVLPDGRADGADGGVPGRVLLQRVGERGESERAGVHGGGLLPDGVVVADAVSAGHVFCADGAERVVAVQQLQRWDVLRRAWADGAGGQLQCGVLLREREPDAGSRDDEQPGWAVRGGAVLPGGVDGGHLVCGGDVCKCEPGECMCHVSGRVPVHAAHRGRSVPGWVVLPFGDGLHGTAVPARLVQQVAGAAVVAGLHGV